MNRILIRLWCCLFIIVAGFDLCKYDIHDRKPIPKRRLFMCCITRRTSMELRAARLSLTKSIHRCSVLADVIFFMRCTNFLIIMRLRFIVIHLLCQARNAACNFLFWDTCMNRILIRLWCCLFIIAAFDLCKIRYP